jgi:hypothetical protein
VLTLNASQITLATHQNPRQHVTNAETQMILAARTAFAMEATRVSIKFASTAETRENHVVQVTNVRKTMVAIKATSVTHVDNIVQFHGNPYAVTVQIQNVYYQLKKVAARITSARRVDGVLVYVM